MKLFPSLWVLDRFARVFRWFGIDYAIMRRILETKLRMDRRRVPTIFNQQGQKKKRKNDPNYFIQSLGVYAFIGLILILFIVLGDNYMFQMSICFAMLMFIMTTSMISDFSSVLLDIRDQDILYTKPVAPRTISAAKTMHIFIYMFLLTGAVTAIPLVVSLFVQGVSFFLIFIAEIILLDLVIVVFTALLYFFILHFFDGEKLKDIINYVQIGLSVAIFVGYQLVARAFEFVDVNISFDPAWWHFFLPPIWYGAPFALLLHGEASPLILVFSALALLVPIAAIWIYVKIMPTFENRLQKLSEHGATAKKGNRFGRFIAALICANREEQAFFRFAGYMMRKEREFKLKVYPSLGLSLALPFLIIFSQLQAYSLAGVTSGRWYFSIYFVMIMIPTIILMVQYSGQYKGAWIFKVAPTQSPAFLYRATLKAFLVKLFLPVYVIESVIFVVLFGWGVVVQLIAALLAAFLYTLTCFKLSSGTIPFSEPFDGMQQSDTWKTLPYIFLIGAFVLVHLLATFFDYGIYGYIAVLVLANGISWKWVFKKSWQ